MITKILFADDEPDVVDVVHKRLTKDGFEVYTALNGHEALDLTIKYNPDLIITDVIMPQMNGFEFCKAVKSNAHTRDIPIVVMTARHNMEDSFLFIGVKDFLYKPVVFSDLESKIKNRLNFAQTMQTQKTKILFHAPKPMVMCYANSLIESVPQWSPLFVNLGKEVLINAEAFVPEVIVLDLLMGDMPIDELIAQLKRIPDLARTPILTYYSPISAAQDSVALQAKMIEVQYLKRITMEAGAKAYLGPFNPGNFMGLLKEYRKNFEE